MAQKEWDPAPHLCCMTQSRSLPLAPLQMGCQCQTIRIHVCLSLLVDVLDMFMVTMRFLAQQGCMVWGLSSEPSGIQQRSKVVQCLLWLGPASDCSELFVAPLCSQSSTLRLHNCPRKVMLLIFSSSLAHACHSLALQGKYGITNASTQIPDQCPLSPYGQCTETAKEPWRSMVFSASPRAHSVPSEAGCAAQSQKFPMANPAPKTLLLCPQAQHFTPLLQFLHL